MNDKKSLLGGIQACLHDNRRNQKNKQVQPKPKLYIGVWPEVGESLFWSRHQKITGKK